MKVLGRENWPYDSLFSAPRGRLLIDLQILRREVVLREPASGANRLVLFQNVRGARFFGALSDHCELCFCWGGGTHCFGAVSDHRHYINLKCVKK